MLLSNICNNWVASQLLLRLKCNMLHIINSVHMVPDRMGKFYEVTLSLRMMRNESVSAMAVIASNGPNVFCQFTFCSVTRYSGLNLFQSSLFTGAKTVLFE